MSLIGLSMDLEFALGLTDIFELSDIMLLQVVFILYLKRFLRVLEELRCFDEISGGYYDSWI